MRNYILILYLALFSFLAKGQESQEQQTESLVPEIFPVSPTVSELGKFGSYPVNLSTGLPQIQIPLYTIKTGDIQIPITLKYHASGIKVNQQSSWVGLGWSLDTGGLISLETRDTPDELEPYLYNLPDVDALHQTMIDHPYNFSHADIVHASTYSWVKDAYHIQLPTVSGTFFLDSDQDGEVTTKFPPDSYKVYRNKTMGVNDDYYYKIIDQQGMQYYFTNTEEVRLNKSVSDDGQSYHAYNTNYTSAWLLGKIQDINGNSVTYQYGTQYAAIQTGKSQSQSYSYTQGSEGYKASFNPIQDAGSSSTSFTNKIQSITFPNGRIRFIMNSNAQYDGVDGEAGKYLEKVVVEKGDASIGYTEVKAIYFTYSITGAANYYTSCNCSKYRFQLDRVYEIGTGQTEKDLAHFEYSSVMLPPSRSQGIDYFGYYNGQSDNQGLIPLRYIEYNQSPSSAQIRTIGSANRKLNIEKMKAGILIGITHPTKGKTQFIYEPNEYYGKNIFLTDEYTQHSLSVIGEGDGTKDPDTENCLEDCVPIESLDLTIDYPSTLYLTGNILCEGLCDITTSKYSYATYSIYNNGVKIKEFRHNRGSYTIANETINLESGNAQVVLEVYGSDMEAHLSLKLWARVTEELNNQNVRGFGLRIKHIQNYDHDGAFIGQKKYSYMVPNTQQSSGILTNQASPYDTFSDFKSFNLSGCVPDASYSRTKTHTYSSSSRSGFENNAISYQFVTEEDLDNQGNTLGKTLYEYTVTPDIVADANAGSIRVNQGHKRGQLLKKQVFNQQNKRLAVEENTYLEHQNKSALREDFKMYTHASSNLDGPPGCVNTYITLDVAKELLHFRNTPVYWYTKDQSKSTQYFYTDSGALQNTITTQTDYTYNNPSHQQVTQTTVSNSKGEVIETSYQYAHEKNDTRMINENRISIPLQTTIKKGSTTLSDQLIKYNTFGELYLPQFIFQKKGSAVSTTATDRRLTHDRYDAQGNLLQYHTEDGLTTSILWGYNGQYPIAKVEGAPYDQISGYVNNISGLRTALPGAMITTYTYEPLVGVTSITAPNGQTQTFTYDELNRLYQVKDHTGKILKEYEYHYQNQNN